MATIAKSKHFMENEVLAQYIEKMEGLEKEINQATNEIIRLELEANYLFQTSERLDEEGRLNEAIEADYEGCKNHEKIEEINKKLINAFEKFENEYGSMH